MRRSTTRMTLYSSLLCLLGLSGRTHRLEAAGTDVPPVTTWAVYWDDKARDGALADAGSWMDEICLFAYAFTSDGRLVPAVEKMKELQNRWQLLPTHRVLTIVNDLQSPQGNQLKDPNIVHQAIATPQARTEHIRQILALAAQADGVDIDYERVRADDTQAFTQFISELAAALHERKKTLSVVVQPRTSEKTTPGMLKNGSGTIDWAAVAQSADVLKVMAYLYSYSTSAPGSIAPATWIEEITTYALRTVPREKLCIVLHLGGLDWPEKGAGKSIDFLPAKAIAESHKVRMEHDRETASATFRYKEGGIRRTVWVEDAQGLQQKVEMLQRLGVPRVGLWRLGAGDPAFWTWLSTHRPHHAPAISSSASPRP